MRWLLVIALAGCAEHGSHPLDASMDRAPCEAAYQQALDRTCTVPVDCTLVEHSDCCGTIWVGVRAASNSPADNRSAASGNAARTWTNDFMPVSVPGLVER